MPFYVADYIADTRHLSTVQHGAYLCLIMHYWAKGSLPDEDQQLANITGLTRAEWLVHKPTIQAFFYDGWKHRRLDAEICRTMERRAKRAASGSKGGTIAAINRWKPRH